MKMSRKEREKKRKALEQTHRQLQVEHARTLQALSTAHHRRRTETVPAEIPKWFLDGILEKSSREMARELSLLFSRELCESQRFREYLQNEVGAAMYVRPTKSSNIEVMDRHTTPGRQITLTVPQMRVTYLMDESLRRSLKGDEQVPITGPDLDVYMAESFYDRQRASSSPESFYTASKF